MLHLSKLTHVHLSENAQVALMAVGFLSLIMGLSYLYWFGA